MKDVYCTRRELEYLEKEAIELFSSISTFYMSILVFTTFLETFNVKNKVLNGCSIYNTLWT